MELSKITIGIIFIFLPGILALMVSERLTDHRERKGYELAAYTLVLGCLSHLLYFIILWSLGKFCITLPKDMWLDLMTSDHVEIQPEVVLFTAILGVLLGFVLCYATTHGWLHRFARRIGATKKFKDLDVWSFLMNSKEMGWVVVRDQAKNLMYQGLVKSFSTEEDPRELVLSPAFVYQNDTGLKLYDAEVIYLALEKKNVTLEIF